jgi:hypothetical protein
MEQGKSHGTNRCIPCSIVAPRSAPNYRIATFVELGSLKGNVGDQNYDVPTETDLSKYRAVTVWCRRFGVNFGTAPLSPRS